MRSYVINNAAFLVLSASRWIKYFEIQTIPHFTLYQRYKNSLLCIKLWQNVWKSLFGPFSGLLGFSGALSVEVKVSRNCIEI